MTESKKSAKDLWIHKILNRYAKEKVYTKTLYSRDINIQDTLEDIPYIQEPLVLEDEVRSALQSLPSWKATGTDEISTEIWEAAEEKSLKVLSKLCQQIWKRPRYISTPKKGNLTENANFHTHP